MGIKNATIEMKLSIEEQNLLMYLRQLRFGEVKIEVVNEEPKKGYIIKESVQWIRFDKPIPIDNP